MEICYKVLLQKDCLYFENDYYECIITLLYIFQVVTDDFL